MDLSDFPSTALEFDSRFSTERACWEFLWNAKWPGGYRCPKCSGSKAYYVIERQLEQCAGCEHQASVTAGTMFHGTRKPLRLWFRAIFEFVSRKYGCNAMDLKRLLGISYQTAWEWLHKIRDVFVRKDRTRLNGTVEADETYIGGPEAGVCGRGRGEKKILVFGAVEVIPDEDGGTRCGRVRLVPVPTASADHLQPALLDSVELGAGVHTDCWMGYRELRHAYAHEITNIKSSRETASELFPHIHRVFSLFRRVLLGTYQGSWSKKYAAMYCEEFTFRFNRRASHSRVHLFKRVMEQAIKRRPRLHTVTGYSHQNPVVPEAA
jgi:transposase-like protein